MVSLTPHSRNAEATNEAMWEGGTSGLLTLLPTAGAVYAAMRHSPTFVARTNYQSRTALVIMPALFIFAWTAEEKLSHKMREIAKETEHSQRTVRWAAAQLAQVQQQQQQRRQRNNADAVKSATEEDDDAVNNNNTEAQLLQLYQQSVQESGIRIVPGDSLRLHHRAANAVAQHPLKVLLGLAVPSVALIFYGRTGKEHLQLSMKLLHTRVFGQFATLSRTLLFFCHVKRVVFVFVCTRSAVVCRGDSSPCRGPRRQGSRAMMYSYDVSTVFLVVCSDDSLWLSFFTFGFHHDC